MVKAVQIKPFGSIVIYLNIKDGWEQMIIGEEYNG